MGAADWGGEAGECDGPGAAAFPSENVLEIVVQQVRDLTLLACRTATWHI